RLRAAGSLTGFGAIPTITASGRRRPTSGRPRPSFWEGDHEGDSVCGTDAWAVRPRERAGHQRGPGRHVQVRVPGRRPKAYVHPDDQEGRGQARRHDELAGSEGDEPQGPEAEGRYSDFFRRAEVHG